MWGGTLPYYQPHYHVGWYITLLPAPPPCRVVHYLITSPTTMWDVCFFPLVFQNMLPYVLFSKVFSFHLLYGTCALYIPYTPETVTTQ